MFWQRCGLVAPLRRFLELFFMGLYRSAAVSLQPALARRAARRCERVRLLCNRLIAQRCGYFSSLGPIWLVRKPAANWSCQELVCAFSHPS